MLCPAIGRPTHLLRLSGEWGKLSGCDNLLLNIFGSSRYLVGLYTCMWFFVKLGCWVLLISFFSFATFLEKVAQKSRISKGSAHSAPDSQWNSQGLPASTEWRVLTCVLIMGFVVPGALCFPSSLLDKFAKMCTVEQVLRNQHIKTESPLTGLLCLIEILESCLLKMYIIVLLINEGW